MKLFFWFAPVKPGADTHTHAACESLCYFWVELSFVWRNVERSRTHVLPVQSLQIQLQHSTFDVHCTPPWLFRSSVPATIVAHARKTNCFVFARRFISWRTAIYRILFFVARIIRRSHTVRAHDWQTDEFLMSKNGSWAASVVNIQASGFENMAQLVRSFICDFYSTIPAICTQKAKRVCVCSWVCALCAFAHNILIENGDAKWPAKFVLAN